MTQERLKKLIEKREVFAALVGDFEGAFSLGIVRDGDGFALGLSLEQPGEDEIVERLLCGEKVRVHITRNFKAPKPLGGT